jgi:hypothetical protein
MHFMGEGGSDAIDALIGLPDSATPRPDDRAILDAAVNLLFADGADRDASLSVGYRNVRIDAPQMLALTGGQDNAASGSEVQHFTTLQMSLNNVVVGAALAVAFTGPGGGGSLVSDDFNNVEHGMPVPLDGTLAITDRGGPFADDIRVVFDFTPQSQSPGGPQELSGSAELHVPHGDPFAVTFELVPAF